MEFKNLTQFDLKRSIAEAIWFYAVYVVFAVLVTLAIGLVILPFLTDDTLQDMALRAKLGRSVAIIVASGLALLIVLAKNYHRNIVYLILVLLTAILASWSGVFLGLAIPAILTLLPKEGEGNSLFGDIEATPPFFDTKAESSNKKDVVKETESTKAEKPETKENVQTVRMEEKGDGYTLIRNEKVDTKAAHADTKTAPIKYSDESSTDEKKETALAKKESTLPSTKTVEPPMVTEEKTEDKKKDAS